MKISNFKLVEVIGNNAITWKFRGTVDVTTGLIFKKTKTVEVYRNYVGHWVFSDTGEYTPMRDVEKLEKSFEAKGGNDLQFLKP